MTDKTPDTDQLTPANDNAWYLMMTLYGEQEGEEINWTLAAQNRRLWNAWICQGMAQEERLRVAEKIGIEAEETEWTEDKAREVAKRFAIRVKDSSTSLKIPHPTETIDLREIAFSDILVLRQAIFRTTSFSGAHFGETTYFRGAHFGETTIFNDAHFGETTDFRGARFGERTFFRGAHFGERTFFIGAHFGEETSFTDAHFGEWTYFSGAHFGEWTSFRDAHFGEETDFDGAHFGERTFFRGAKFDGFSYFTEARFGSKQDNRPCRPDFANAVFGGPTSFEGAEFATHLPVFTGATLHDTTTLTADPNLWPPNRESLWLRFTRFLRLAKPADEGLQPHSEAKASAAKLRHVMARQMLSEEEHFFFRREMHHTARAQPIWKTGHICFFEVVSDFGHSIGRPFWALAVLWAAGLWVYARFAMWKEEAPFGWGEAAGYSFANMFKFFGLHRTYFEFDVIRDWPGWLQWVSGTQTVLAFILLFFLGLGLRTRFRLR